MESTVYLYALRIERSYMLDRCNFGRHIWYCSRYSDTGPPESQADGTRVQPRAGQIWLCYAVFYAQRSCWSRLVPFSTTCAHARFDPSRVRRDGTRRDQAPQQSYNHDAGTITNGFFTVLSNSGSLNRRRLSLTRKMQPLSSNNSYILALLHLDSCARRKRTSWSE